MCIATDRSDIDLDAALVRKARDLLLTVNVEHRVDHPSAELSVGECQRVANALALASDPKVLLAGEPTRNLDSRSAAEILDFFDRIRTQCGVMLVVITHNLAVTKRAGRVIGLLDGRVVKDSNQQGGDRC